MADVFISYKTERRRAAEFLKRIIEAHGYSVWYDYRGLVAGPDFGPQIEKQLKNAKAAIVLWCDLARDSQWVREEADLAKTLGNYIPTKITTGVELPLGFRLNHHVDLSNWDGSPRSAALDPLILEIERLVQRPAVISHAQARALEADWHTYGKPTPQTFSLELADEDRVGQRSWSVAPRQIETSAETRETQPSLAPTSGFKLVVPAAVQEQYDKSREIMKRARDLYYGFDGTTLDQEKGSEYYAEAIPLLRVCADAGIATAQDELGDCLWYGRGVSINQPEAMRLYLQSGKQGYKFAALSLGLAYRRGGDGIAKNPAKAREWFARCESSIAMARMQLAEMHEFGEGGPVDLPAAIAIYRKLANGSSAGAAKSAQEQLVRLGEEW